MIPSKPYIGNKIRREHPLDAIERQDKKRYEIPSPSGSPPASPPRVQPCKVRVVDSPAGSPIKEVIPTNGTHPRIDTPHKEVVVTSAPAMSSVALPPTPTPRISIASFAMGKMGDMVVLPGVPTNVMGWADDLPTHIPHSWFNLRSGMFTIAQPCTLTITGLDIIWKSGVCHIGSRILRIRCMSESNPAKVITLHEDHTSAAINKDIPTRQHVDHCIKCVPGMRVFFEIEHDAPVPLIVSAKNSKLCGLIM